MQINKKKDNLNKKDSYKPEFSHLLLFR